MQIHEGRVFTFGFDKEREIRKAKERRLKMVENGAFEDLRHQKCPIPEGSRTKNDSQRTVIELKKASVFSYFC